jgi:hypothetical protein
MRVAFHTRVMRKPAPGSVLVWAPRLGLDSEAERALARPRRGERSE